MASIQWTREFESSRTAEPVGHEHQVKESLIAPSGILIIRGNGNDTEIFCAIVPWL